MGISMIVDEIIKVSALLVEERRKKDVVEKRIDELEQNLASLKQQLQNDFEEGKKKNEEEVEARIEAVRQEGKRKMKKKIANLKKKHRLMSDAGSRASGSGKPSFLSSTDKEESTNSSDSET